MPGERRKEEYVTEGAQNLNRAIREQTLKSAQDFYGDSLGSLKGQLEDDRSQLQELLDQLPHSQGDARAQLEQMVESYEAIGDSLDDAARQHGVLDAVEGTAQQAAEGAQDTETEAAKSSRRDKVKGAATSAAGRALQAAGSLTGDRSTRIKGFLARRKGAFDKKKGESKELLDQ